MMNPGLAELLDTLDSQKFAATVERLFGYATTPWNLPERQYRFLRIVLTG